MADDFLFNINSLEQYIIFLKLYNMNRLLVSLFYTYEVISITLIDIVTYLILNIIHSNLYLDLILEILLSVNLILFYIQYF